ncbi:MAG: PEP-CTERM sorting domain-containing protein [Gemmataceae bacterium]
MIPTWIAPPLHRLATVLLTTAIVTLPGAAPAQVLYTIQDLGTLGGAVSSFGQGINAAGQVTGYSLTSGTPRAFRTTATGLVSDAGTDLGTLGGTFSVGSGINASGQVTGETTTAGGASHAFRTTATGLVSDPGADLGALGFGRSVGTAINASGQVAGWYDRNINGNPYPQAFRTTATGLLTDPGTDLGTLGGLTSRAGGINAAGQVTGLSTTASGAQHAFRTSASGLVSDAGTDLGTLSGGTLSAGLAINDSGQVVGYSTTASGAQHAFRSSPNGQPVTLADLGTLGGDGSVANSVNALGVLVGSSTITVGGSDSHAFVYDTQMRDLNAQLVNGPGWILVSASSINDAGQITGWGTLNGQTHAYRLTPTLVPEPSALALAGFAFALWTARKQSRRK